MKRPAPLTLETGDPRIATMRDAGRLRADEIMLKDGWRMAPAQCPIYMEALKTAQPGEAAALATIWLDAYHTRIREHGTHTI